MMTVTFANRLAESWTIIKETFSWEEHSSYSFTGECLQLFRYVRASINRK